MEARWRMPEVTRLPQRECPLWSRAHSSRGSIRKRSIIIREGEELPRVSLVVDGSMSSPLLDQSPRPTAARSFVITGGADIESGTHGRADVLAIARGLEETLLTQPIAEAVDPGV
jgi:hypothetical protein